MIYQSLTRIKKKNATYNLIMAGRDTGKSTAITRELIDDYKATGHKFIRLFRKTGNSYDAADSWFDEYNEGGKFYEGDVFEFRSDGNYYINGELFGYTAIISLARNYRSGVYPASVYTAVYDEYIGITPDEYVDGEVKKFKSILTTVFRHRECKIWLLGNNYNEMSKYNPYHTYFGIDIDRDKIKQGDIRVYKSKRFKNPAKIAFEFGRIAYESEEEIPLSERIDGNEVATSGEFARPWDVFIQDDRYEHRPSFLRDSIDNYFIADTFGRCYFPVVNEELQSIDWISTPEDLLAIGKTGDETHYKALIDYADYFMEQYGEEEYYEELENSMPYDIAIPLFKDGNRYGENCQGFISGINKIYTGFTYQYADGNIKYLFEKIILGNKMD